MHVPMSKLKDVALKISNEAEKEVHCLLKLKHENIVAVGNWSKPSEKK